MSMKSPSMKTPCQQFVEHPSKDPITGKSIRHRSKRAKEYSAMCYENPLFQDHKCSVWKHKKGENPVTRRSIKKGGKEYNKLALECESKKKILKGWKKNGFPLRNPFTNRPIKKSGKVYKALLAECVKHGILGSGSPRVKKTTSPRMKKTTSPRMKKTTSPLRKVKSSQRPVRRVASAGRMSA